MMLLYHSDDAGQHLGESACGWDGLSKENGPQSIDRSCGGLMTNDASTGIGRSSGVEFFAVSWASA